MNVTNVRIARRYAGMVEVLGEWFVSDQNDPKMKSILKDLHSAQEEEPTAGWILETRGTVSDWHEWVLDFPRFCAVGCGRVLNDRTEARHERFQNMANGNVWHDWVCKGSCEPERALDPGPAL